MAAAPGFPAVAAFRLSGVGSRASGELARGVVNGEPDVLGMAGDAGGDVRVLAGSGL